jgi:hypothetical protein
MEKTQARPFPRRPATNQRQALPPKRRAEIAELAFMQKAVSLGFGVAKPWGDEDRCDYILDAGGRFWRVQVRSTAYESHRGYAVHTYVYVKRKMVALTADEIDCIIAYIVPLNLWYVLPVESFSPCKNLWFYPHGSKKGSRFESFREAWWLLSPELKPMCEEDPTKAANPAMPPTRHYLAAKRRQSAAQGVSPGYDEGRYSPEGAKESDPAVDPPR